jgi:diguanylate cyclase
VPPAAQQEDWRRKYFDSITAIEDEARQYQNRLQILYRLVGRLCAVAQGQSPRIDVELKRLRDAIRRETRAEELESFGEAIAQAVREMEGGETGRTAAPLSSSLISPITSIDSAGISPVSPARRDGTAGNAGNNGERLCDVLLRLLSELRREPELVSGIEALDTEISVSLTFEQLPDVIEKVGGMLLQRIRHLEKARQGLAELLEQMLGQLDSLNSYIKGEGEEETRRNQSSDTLNLQITGEVRAIAESVGNSGSLEQLRMQLSQRLLSIGKHLQGFRDREQEHARQSRERAARMRARMEEMENEAKALQVRLSDEQRQSMRDPLTRIPNRLSWEQRIAEELGRWQRFHQPTCVLAWDIDGFKGINDKYGHRAGDKVLVVVAESLATGIRGTDFVARYGGEEFVMLLPGTSLANGVIIADQMREVIAQTGFHFRGTPVSVTISCGITELREGDKPEDAFDRADRAMYQAKNSGRNRVMSG